MAVKGKEEVMLIRLGEPDRNGDPTGNAVLLGIFEQCVVWPRVSTEVSEKGTVITEGYNVWIPWVGGNRATLDESLGLRATDMAVVRDVPWLLDGTPADHRSMRGKRLGVQMIVGRVA